MASDVQNLKRDQKYPYALQIWAIYPPRNQFFISHRTRKRTIPSSERLGGMWVVSEEGSFPEFLEIPGSLL